MSSHGGAGGGGDGGPAGDAGPAEHWPQVCAQLLWNHGRWHSRVFVSHQVLGLMSWHGAGGGGSGRERGLHVHIACP